MHQSNGFPAVEQSMLQTATTTAVAFADSSRAAYMVQNHATPRNAIARPSTAPPSQETVLLPVEHTYRPSYRPPLSNLVKQDASEQYINDSEPPTRHDPMQSLSEDDSSTVFASSSNTPETPPCDVPQFAELDWATFVTNYAAGLWDPHKPPIRPVPYRVLASQAQFRAAQPFRNRPKEISKLADSEPSSDQRQGSELRRSTSDSSLASQSDERSPTLEPKPPAPPVKSTSFRLSIPLNLPLPTHRPLSSFSTSLPNHPTAPNQHHNQNSIHNSDVHASAATMRWAASRVDISPLALPSPERELTDPMHGVTVPLSQNGDRPMTPGSNRKSRLSGFWEGTTDVDGAGATNTKVGPRLLSPIQGSPSEPDLKPVDRSTNGGGLIPPPTGLPPASAPTSRERNEIGAEPTDYFGGAFHSFSPAAASTNGKPKSAPVAAIIAEELTLGNNLPLEHGTLTEPVVSKRVSLTRQSSSPLPTTAPADTRYLGARVVDTISALRMRRALKEEQKFEEQGYLSPPHPPDELERRRAMHKFNLWHTGVDVNFDRIAQLTKLVFNTKGVCLSLVDSDEQWFKAELGLGADNCERSQSICGHTILQRSDEPMVLLDTHRDWRFSKNLFVLGGPQVRFYAGAPLRTSDGYNIGTLCVIDPEPREEFSPRERHTLKEFAAIAMREMELWREKIQIRIRERIQTSMERFSRECLEIDGDGDGHERHDIIASTSMDRVYDRAAKLVKRTLDVESVMVMDVSHCEVLETMNEESSVSVTVHHGEPGKEMTKRQLTSEEYHKLNCFFEKYPDGRISEGITPHSFRQFLPTHVQYALIVPIFNVDKRPFALLCAYNATDEQKRFLEGHELSYLRAIGVIILSAVLKRRMILADKAKALFISNISHELRTPLHGILAAAELLNDSSLNHSQASYLQTVQACGTSLVETVNHVLDFTKLSGNGKSGGVENVIVPTTVDLMQLVEEAVDGCWIGHRARMATAGDTGIGSVYSPPKEEHGSPVATREGRKLVESVVDIGYCPEGWAIKCEKGGIRRVLMNLFSNSLKFTSDGYVHVVLRQLPSGGDDPPNKIKVELSVYDTGKGISQNFLKNQLFHPFSQENPLQTGTGLGLAIVNSIVTSENVGGKVDVWSEEGVGTEIKITFPAEVSDDERTPPSDMDPLRVDESETLPTVSLVGFQFPHKGVKLLHDTLCGYLSTWWGFHLVEEDGDIVILNEDPAMVVLATERRDTTRPFIILSSARGSAKIMSIASEHERIGGFCRVLYKPGGPSRLRTVLSLSLHALAIGKSSGTSPLLGPVNGDMTVPATEITRLGGNIPRRNSEEAHTRRATTLRRPQMTARSSTAHPAPAMWSIPSTPEPVEVPDLETPVPTITIGNGGTLLKAAVGTLDNDRPFKFRVLVVEDNSILRNLLMKWLSSKVRSVLRQKHVDANKSFKGYDFRAAVDGRDGVNVYSQQGPFDVVLLDMSMPILDGVGATLEIRQFEEEAKKTSSFPVAKARILALTGMSSLEDKRRAFDAGVDGYLVKPVAFKTLDDMFHKLGMA